MLAALLVLLASLDLAEVPSEVRAFVPKGHEAISVEQGDLNRDGMQDYVVVLERTGSEDEPRAVLVLTRQANGSLTLARTRLVPPRPDLATRACRGAELPHRRAGQGRDDRAHPAEGLREDRSRGVRSGKVSGERAEVGGPIPALA